MTTTKIPARLHLSIPLLASSLICLSGCGGGGGGGGSSPSQASGQIFDSLVEGLHYSSGSVSGLTDANGSFEYTPGADVTFSVGDIVLGTVHASSLISIVDFVEGETNYDGGSNKIVNIARFLQTIDFDGFPANGIVIDASTRAAAKGQAMEFDLEDWGSDPDVLATLELLTTNPLVSALDAQDHGDAWLAASRAGEYSGTWVADVGGPASGPLRLSVSTAGTVVLIAGLGDSDTGGWSEDGHDVTGSGQFEVFTDHAMFHGTIAGTSVSGTWTGQGDWAGMSGTFAGSLSVKPLTFLDMEHIDQFAYMHGLSINGLVFDDGNEADVVAAFHMELNGDSYGRYEIDTTVNMIIGDVEHCSFYVTSMDDARILFRGLCTSGEGFSGSLYQNGDVSGIYYNLEPSDPGGTFTGGLD